jgi:hypothetical protein
MAAYLSHDVDDALSVRIFRLIARLHFDQHERAPRSRQGEHVGPGRESIHCNKIYFGDDGVS